MDWEDKFSSIVRETELNLAKAKQKLSGKIEKPSIRTSRDDLKPMKSNPKILRRNSMKEKYSDGLNDGTFDLSFGMMSVSSAQVMHMQEQIDSQDRTIEKLKRLVKTLDSERDYYKDQISSLKGEVDLLTSTMKNQSSLFTSELKMSNVKREVLKEVEKVKSMVQSFENNSARRTPILSPRFDPEFWNIKENLSTSLEQVRLELSYMKGRIDRMESQLATDTLKRMQHENTNGRNLFDPCESYRTRTLYTPTSKVTPSVTESDLKQMSAAISSINTKLDSIERKNQLENAEGNKRPYKSVLRSSSYFSPRSTKPSFRYLDDEVQSLSDPSELYSDVSDNNYDSDDDVDLYGMNFGTSPGNYSSSVLLKETSKKSGKVEFDLSDLDLSDGDDEQAGSLDDFDIDTLELDAVDDVDSVI